METILNLVWLLLAGILVCLWIRHAPRRGASRQMQVASLAILILMLFPVISVTDDLQAAQNPTEVETCVRRGHLAGSPHFLFPIIAIQPPSFFSAQPFGYRRIAVPSWRPSPTVDNPALAAIQNRPPPAI